MTSAEDGCTPPPPPAVAPGWSLAGYHPAPPLEDLLATGHHHGVLVAVTRSQLCTSEDGGEHWTPRIGAGSPPGSSRGAPLDVPLDVPLDAPRVVALPGMDALVAIAQGTTEEWSLPRVFVSRDDGVRWEPLALPPPAGPRARAFTDQVGRIYVASPTRLWTSLDGRTFGPARALPGTTADGVDACGETLIARAVVGGDGFYHRSDDHGATWRPFRLGAIGLEGEGTVLRCVGWRGAIEAGRAPLPAWWTFDQGRTWEPARYDATARGLARTQADEGRGLGGRSAEGPHCATGPTGQLVCMDAGRLVLPEAREHPEIHAPAGCEHVRLVDDRRTMAFGPSCGLVVSTDRGGAWHPVVTRAPHRAPAPSATGRGGFLSTDVAWRLEGGVWWTQDGGAHWRLVASGASHTLDRGVFVDREHGVFVQSDGWVVATRDGGRTWTFVLRGEVERVAGAGRWVMVTTADRMRVSPDGGVTWRTTGTIPAAVALDPALEVVGAERRFDPLPGLRVVQQGDRIRVQVRGGALDGRSVATTTSEIARGLAREHDLLAAHATGPVVDRVLLAGGAMLRRTPGARASLR